MGQCSAKLRGGSSAPPPDTLRVVGDAYSDAYALSPGGAEPASLRQYKLVMCGDKATGKSSLVLRFTKDAFAEYVSSTIGAAFASKDVKCADGTPVKLQLWDTAGEELYRAMTRSFFRESAAGLVVYDVTCQPTFDSLTSWLRDFREQCPDAVAVLVANKCDRVSERAVQAASGAEFAAANGMLFHEVSAKSGAGVRELFAAIADRLVAQSRDASRGVTGPGHTAYG